ncbi:MAG: hypothetical protein ABH863_03815 [Candidatus Micrarchaeota archaeon]
MMTGKKKARAQSGIEFVAFFGFMIMLMIVLSIEAADRMRIIQRNRDILEAERVGSIAAININTAFSVGDGYSSRFFMPYGLLNSDYYINITNEEQRLDVTYGENFTRGFPLLSGNVTGEIAQGENLINNTLGEIIIA